MDFQNFDVYYCIAQQVEHGKPKPSLGYGWPSLGLSHPLLGVSDGSIEKLREVAVHCFLTEVKWLTTRTFANQLVL